MKIRTILAIIYFNVIFISGGLGRAQSDRYPGNDSLYKGIETPIVINPLLRKGNDEVPVPDYAPYSGTMVKLEPEPKPETVVTPPRKEVIPPPPIPTAPEPVSPKPVSPKSAIPAPVVSKPKTEIQTTPVVKALPALPAKVEKTEPQKTVVTAPVRKPKAEPPVRVTVTQPTVHILAPIPPQISRTEPSVVTSIPSIPRTEPSISPMPRTEPFVTAVPSVPRTEPIVTAIPPMPRTEPSVTAFPSIPRAEPVATALPSRTGSENFRAPSPYVQARPVVHLVPQPTGVVSIPKIAPPDSFGADFPNLMVLRKASHLLAREGVVFKQDRSHPAFGGLDAPGAIQYLLTEIGVSGVPRTIVEQSRWVRMHGLLHEFNGKPSVRELSDSLYPGNLVFWGEPETGVDHVMIYLGYVARLDQHQAFGTRGGTERGINGHEVDVFELHLDRDRITSTGRIPGLSGQ